MNTKRAQLYRMFFGHKELSLIDYLYNSSSDEIVEIDILNDTMRQIYHTEGKFFIPHLERSFVNIFDFALQGIVHPDDLEIFNNLMDPRTILDRLHNNKETPNFLMDHFRYRLANGQWRWVEQCVITGKENGIDEGKIIVFIRDIENQKLRDKGKQLATEEFGLEQGKDELTRLYRSDFFFSHAFQKLKDNPEEKWALLLIDIENFRLFDEWYGRSEGDLLLANIGNYIQILQDDHNCLGGYFGQDDFAILLPFDMDLIRSVYDHIKDATLKHGHSDGFAPAFGIYVFEDDIDVKMAYDLAGIATAKAKKDIKNRIVIYDPKFKQNEENEQLILSEAMEAIHNNEIIFYLQPQCRISSKKIIGAEALARWIKKDGTVVPPLNYIPVLEKYGFISDLDKVIWEKVFKWLREWIDKGHKAVPISVNVSRADIFAVDVSEYFVRLSEKYNIPPKYIKVEITESSYAETTEKVGELVQTLRNNNFTVLMDDFGSGYSSLNVLRNLKVDVIKLDALFLNFESEDEKGIHIIESVVNMTKQISLPVIVEGVETKEQVEFLRGLGCRYIQGFYFYKPMPISEFEKLILNEDIIDERGVIFKHNDQFRVQEFLDKNIYSDTMLNSILGPVAVYALDGENVDIVRYNEQFYKAVNVPDFTEKIEGIQKVMPPEDAKVLFSLLHEAAKNKLNGSSGTLRFFTQNGTVVSFIIHFFYLGEQNGSKRFYGSATNVTNLTDLKEELALLSDYSRDALAFVRRIDNQWTYKVASHTLSDLLGITRDELEKEMNEGYFMARVINKEEFKKFILNLHQCYENDLDASFTIQLKDCKDVERNIHIYYNNVTNKTNNVKFVLYFDIEKN